MTMAVTVGPRPPALPHRAALVSLDQRAPLTALDARLACRAAVYVAFGHRRAARFALREALSSAGAVAAPIHLRLEPVHRRGWGSCSAALAPGELPDAAIEALLAQYPVAAAAAGPPLSGVDTSGGPSSEWAAATRRCRDQPRAGGLPPCLPPLTRHSNGQPIAQGAPGRLVVPLAGPHLAGRCPSICSGTPLPLVHACARLCKQSLDWTTLRGRQPAAAARWTWLVVRAYTPLRRAAGRHRPALALDTLGASVARGPRDPLSCPPGGGAASGPRRHPRRATTTLRPPRRTGQGGPRPPRHPHAGHQIDPLS